MGMSLKNAARDLINRQMNRLSAKEKEFSDGLKYWLDAKAEIKRTKEGKVELADIMIDLHEEKINSIKAEKEKLTSKSMGFFQDIAVEGLSNTEIEYYPEFEF